MIKACLLIFAGGIAAQHSRVLPGSDLVQFALVASVALLVCGRTRLVGCLLLGAALFMQAGQSIVSQQLDSRFVGDSLLTQVRVVDFPRASGASIVMRVTPVADKRLPPLSKVTWFEPPALPAIGDTWELELRLRRPRGSSNPGLFDYEAWLFRESIHATGYVVNGKRNRLLKTGSTSYVERRRRSFVERAVTVAKDPAAGAVIAAVGVGARHRISRDQWHRYAQTGVSHLMAISGLHVGLAAGTAFLLTMTALAIARAAMNHYLVAIAAGVLAAVGYTTLSGLGIPARRATLMLLVAAAMLIRRRHVDPLMAMAVAGILIFVAEPIAIMAPGFGLSFAAVALLVWLSRRRQQHRLSVAPIYRVGRFVHQTVVMQVILLAGLMPLTILYFQRIAFLAVPANLLAVPLFSLVTVPATLLALALGDASAPVGDFALRIASYTVAWLEELISMLLQWPGADITVASVTGVTWLAVVMPAAWAVLPKGWPGRHCVLIAIPFLILYKPAPPPAGCFDAHILDVGQGLSIVVQTASSAVIYDTGIAFRGGGSIAEAVVLPFLRSRGIGHVDRLIISHADVDHSGGARDILAKIPVRQTLLGEEWRNAVGTTEPCRAGQSWQSDGVSFRILYPPPASRQQGNNASCVLRVAVGQHNLLLTGDIEAAAERELLRQLEARADVVVVPHHGSATSSTAALVKRLAPRLAIISAGYMNRWGLPKQPVVERWQQVGARVLNTANDGAISLTLCKRGGIRQLRADRDRRRRFWRPGAE
jgi:competence protein ComEC